MHKTIIQQHLQSNRTHTASPAWLPRFVSWFAVCVDVGGERSWELLWDCAVLWEPFGLTEQNKGSSYAHWERQKYSHGSVCQQSPLQNINLIVNLFLIVHGSSQHRFVPHELWVASPDPFKQQNLPEPSFFLHISNEGKLVMKRKWYGIRLDSCFSYCSPLMRKKIFLYLLE